jgi:hypothetical protein
MKVFTFYSPVEGKREHEERALIDLWKRSWAAMGWEPTVLGYQSLTFDDEISALVRKFKKLPSMNKFNLDYWCYLRWVAVAQQGGGFMCDYDVINYSFEPRPFDQLTVYARNEEQYVPCLVSGTSSEFMRAVGWFASYRVPMFARFMERSHTSDMLILKEHSSSFKLCTECIEYGDAGWDTASAVHYCNRVMRPNDLMPRHEHIERLRPLPSSAAAA